MIRTEHFWKRVKALPSTFAKHYRGCRKYQSRRGSARYAFLLTKELIWA